MSKKFEIFSKDNILLNPHFWIIAGITAVLTFLYSIWPWVFWEIHVGGFYMEFSFPLLTRLAIFETQYHVIGSLFMIPIIYGALIFWWKGALIGWALSMVGALPVIFRIFKMPEYRIINLSYLFIPLAIISLITFDINRRSKERKIFLERERERQEYITKILETEERERQRIAQELHDGTIQTLLAVATRAQSLVSTSSLDDVHESSVWLRDTTMNTIEELRHLSLDLRPSILTNFGLIPAIKSMVKDSTKSGTIKFNLEINGEVKRFSNNVETAIFRVVQAAVSNIKRHSGAKVVNITLEFTEQHLRATIHDDGQGFLKPKRLASFASRNKLGLIGMEQRIQSIGGKFLIFSNPGEGTTVFIEVYYPLKTSNPQKPD